MVTITLPPELEEIVTEHAARIGTTPERVALDSLRRQLLPVPPPPPAPEGSLADFLGEYIGCLHSRERVPGGSTRR